jgi:hypothetical protein
MVTASESATVQTQRTGTLTGDATGTARGSGARRSVLVTTAGSGHGPSAALVLPAAPGTLDAAAVAEIREDMAIMSRILEKAVRPEASIRARYVVSQYQYGASGADLTTLPITATGVPSEQAVFLEGFGALFVIGVDFPLVERAGAEKQQAEEPNPSVWEQTRRELYGQGGTSGGGLTPWSPGTGGSGFGGTTPGQTPPRRDYDEKRVTDLRNAIVEAFRHAAYLRHLKPPEVVVLAVVEDPALGGSAWVSSYYGAVAAFTRSQANAAGTDMGVSPQTVLTVRARKADIDAFAKGEMPVDNFRKTLLELAY